MNNISLKVLTIQDFQAKASICNTGNGTQSYCFKIYPLEEERWFDDIFNVLERFQLNCRTFIE